VLYLLRWEQRDLSHASSVSLPTIKRLESKPGAMAAHRSTVVALRKALESGGIEFVDENGGGTGVWLRNRQQNMRTRPAYLESASKVMKHKRSDARAA
jgi:hypothetical protein